MKKSKENTINNMKASAFGGKWQITRFILILLPIVWICFPMYDYVKIESVDAPVETGYISLITLIQSIFSYVIKKDTSAVSLDVWLTDKVYFCILILIVCIIVFSIASLIISLFSVGKGAMIRIILFQVICYIVVIGLGYLPLYYSSDPNVGFSSSIGFKMVSLTYLLIIESHRQVDKKLNPTKYKQSTQ